MSATMERQGALEIRAVHPHIGAEVTGLDLREPLAGAEFEAVRDAFNRYSVLVFRNQDPPAIKKRYAMRV